MHGRYNSDDSDISRIFAQKVDKYNKDFGKFGRSNQRDQNDIKTNELSIKLIEAEEKISSLSRVGETKDREIERLQRSAKAASDRISDLASQNNSLKAELERSKRTSRDFGEDKMKEKILLDDYKTALNKYLTWFMYSEKQMAIMKEFFQECGGWTEENRYKIYFSYKEIEPKAVTDDEVADLCKTSVFDYQGIEEIGSISEFEQRLKFHNISTQTDILEETSRLESGFIQNSEDAEIMSGTGSQPLPFDPAASGHSYDAMSAEEMRSLTQMEKIQNLESENTHLKNQMMILGGKAKYNALLEEQKLDLQSKLEFLKTQNNRIIEEHEKLKETINASFGQRNAQSLTDILKNLQEANERNHKLEERIKELSETQESGPSASKTDETRRIAHFFQQKYQKEIDDLKNKLAEYQPLHQSDTTRILRFQGSNPLDEAYEEHVVNQAAEAATSSGAAQFKRRKLDSTNSGEDYSGNSINNNPDEKEENSELAKSNTELRHKLKRVNKEFERSIQLQKDLALQYRQIVTLLTGYQIKMREEGFCEVGNVLDQGGVFIFQRREDNGMDLLDNECAQRWKEVVENYLAKYNSVPAFLAAVNLALVENNVSFGSTFFNITKA